MNKIKYGIISTAILSLVLLFSVSYTKANPSFFLRGPLSTSINTVSYLSPGAATTTIGSLSTSGTAQAYFDLGASGAQGADSAILLLNLIGSTTPSAGSSVATTTYNVAIEYSQDNVTWYGDTYSPSATTTLAINLSTLTTHSITLGATTLNGLAVASTTATTRIFNVPVPTKYVRAVVTIPQGSTNGSVWGEFVAKRQAN